MIAQEVIRKKRDGGALNASEVSFFIRGLCEGSIPDYQISALLMAIYWRGMQPEETACLLKAMMDSGVQHSWPMEKRKQSPFVDKHSTGGVGDKTSLIILPLLVAEGFHVPMIAGRGLGHTGGTLDKLESIPGTLTRLDSKRFSSQVLRLGGAFGAQTEDFVPADRKLYALRDVTSTVESLPLIVSSIMSKKLGEGLDALVLDVKFGSGSFMGSLDRARTLGQALKAVGEAAGCRVDVALTSMDQPLGRNAGNSLEVLECLEILEGKSAADDTLVLSVELAAKVACRALRKESQEDHQDCALRMRKHIASGKALEIFQRVLIEQGADPACVTLKDRKWISEGTFEFPLFSGESGILQSIETRALGMALVELGAGRKKTEDKVLPGVGLSRISKIGEATSPKDPLCVVHAANEADFKKVQNQIRQAFRVSTKKPIGSGALIHSWI